MFNLDSLPYVNLSNAKTAATPIKSAEEIRLEWLASRRGFFTASNAGSLMGYEDKNELPAGAKTLTAQVAIERLTVFNPDRPRKFSGNGFTQWGNDKELEAIAALEKHLGVVFESTGINQSFFKHPGFGGNWVGGTPDAIIREALIKPSPYIHVACGAEIKCPSSEKHFEYLAIETQEDFKQACKDYYWQVQQLMSVTAAKYWYFVSYDPDFISESKRLKVLKIMRNDADIKKLENRLLLAIDYAKSLML